MATPRGQKVGTLAQIVGRNVKDLRDQEKPKLSQADLGERIAQYLGGDPLPKQTIYKIERGTRSLSAEELVAVSLALGVSVSVLLTAHAYADVDEIALTDDTETFAMTLDELRDTVLGDAQAAARMEVRRKLLAQIVGFVAETSEASHIKPIKATPRRRRKNR